MNLIPVLRASALLRAIISSIGASHRAQERREFVELRSRTTCCPRATWRVAAAAHRISDVGMRRAGCLHGSDGAQWRSCERAHWQAVMWPGCACCVDRGCHAAVLLRADGLLAACQPRLRAPLSMPWPACWMCAVELGVEASFPLAAVCLRACSADRAHAARCCSLLLSMPPGGTMFRTWPPRNMG